MEFSTDSPKVNTIILWNRAHAVIMLSGLSFCVFFNSIGLLTLMAVLSFCFFGYRLRGEWKQLSPVFGWANYITAFRFCILIFAFLFFESSDKMYLALSLSSFVVLDYFDGYLARSRSETTDFGKYFDMEVDAFYVCLLCTYFYLEGFMPIWILFIGALRYINILAEQIFLNRSKLDARFPLAALIAVVMFVSLITPFLLSKEYYYPIISLSSILVVVSFGSVFVQNLWSKKV